MADASGVLGVSPVIPVVTIDDPQDAVPLARALVDGGVKIIELTLRTTSALTSLKLIADEVPEILVGAGTILTPQQADDAVAAGAQFLVSPGVTPALLTAMLSTGVPVLPGVATVGEVLAVLEQGLDTMKFFPAGPAGGPKYLAAIGAPVPHVRFCPTGGISLATAPDYLKLPNVACVGGSWLTPADAVAAKDWARITTLASGAAALAR
ncbi:2-dehydro-3-deoxyphosphogluconate aldolase/4-hydroxy-2-oxoglutarate aldolase [Pseudarthrobacter chlorophenolicus A6]|uniref:2-dehydro-3-deoxy-phosphogluconate aldolase n=1 Tax=Pseudarthrobacter chlorophenolicus (strain ATCC 700700 / DSM 12829 / CIP 107037 / JCM 12360 / KCTC 9906 / NCIMB 13794 / A6) TaxID=452863 RepID=B8HDJ6_PSECP|nr:bifunctional 4-hydroxy-2-oxoglutarate aldolase/2-dehydro-3-deoxy-phosphogluconate aldolase [Pseudarthrobacter chlorophenolicus]ACL39001.1 2-dehydro-3-deoxyphosphogluconate aldolase/4-hydroxy-2-oxoglutarate aldolase [Pseudarthrobacter chlorophenolicus A6]SDR05792.1 2-dehydro-3-deoxyphosphogluconate aldolase / (4S)-4-hydroxy-2-oxoglutarate aldolase [Pseudarthrobacter chlorophenolicus]